MEREDRKEAVKRRKTRRYIKNMIKQEMDMKDLKRYMTMVENKG